MSQSHFGEPRARKSGGDRVKVAVARVVVGPGVAVVLGWVLRAASWHRGALCVVGWGGGDRLRSRCDSRGCDVARGALCCDGVGVGLARSGWAWRWSGGSRCGAFGVGVTSLQGGSSWVVSVAMCRVRGAVARQGGAFARGTGGGWGRQGHELRCGGEVAAAVTWSAEAELVVVGWGLACRDGMASGRGFRAAQYWWWRPIETGPRGSCGDVACEKRYEKKKRKMYLRARLAHRGRDFAWRDTGGGGELEAKDGGGGYGLCVVRRRQ
ncbi:hypothetical protein EDB85DRAFT_1897546 [Lactarius pseudohatsudake]|nr:hypothetical protein EDB85DRAFT_1897546 [Lactarius pseudohatsudake]